MKKSSSRGKGFGRLEFMQSPYKGVGWRITLAPPGLPDQAGDEIIAHTTLSYRDWEWQGWVTRSNETRDGLDFSFEVTGSDRLEQIADLALARNKVRRYMAAELEALLSSHP